MRLSSTDKTSERASYEGCRESVSVGSVQWSVRGWLGKPESNEREYSSHEKSRDACTKNKKVFVPVLEVGPGQR